MPLTPKHKKQLIGGIIGVFILTLTLFVKYIFTNNDTVAKPNTDTLKPIIQSPVIKNINQDSATQTINQITQTNSNKGDVNNEFVSGNKIINQKTVVVNNEKEKKAQRTVSKSDIQKIKTIPKNYLIEINYSFADNECNKYGIELSNTFTELGYKVQTNIYGQMLTNTYDDRFEIRLKDTENKAEIIVHVLKE